MLAERLKTDTRGGLTLVEARTNRKNMGVFGLEQPIPDYYEGILIKIPGMAKEPLSRYLFVLSTDPDEEVSISDLMEVVYEYTGTIIIGQSSRVSFRVEAPDKQKGQSRFRILNKNDLNSEDRYLVSDLLVDHGLVALRSEYTKL
ncbi:hypothetical protein A2803_04815 [Candidatus Woesebacteria bacterium RIFCSPHIGHO2_01_FULL_44_21]|uniref:Uncharacterized protein n=1 Tax=Candidatus Woesebacteria bacterium RIFCSPHIGHO2_01_FULL_44_21 TaxID=1802503 RepID=A0A1F7Z333_9BACT|nr:MAG: hypothetical protein A2803_04815 [Candidatus Woesebacteria bacterium RIFCSPHIGHO2_01_FULL_44_21]OGM69440.1 MAG: hypothetical protein A2897_03745 [Candidatus Woesebacteria bacterium RIFCSPLOWO2_01_FULL_44_24b]